MENEKLYIKKGIILKGYLIFPLIFGAIFLLLTIGLYFIDERAGLIASGLFCAYGTAFGIFYLLNNTKLEKSLIRFARQYGGLEGELISDFPIPYVITDPDGGIIAYNKVFGRIYDEKSGIDTISKVFHQVTKKDLKFEGNSNNISLVYDNRNYRLCIKHLKVTKDLIESKIALLPEHDMTLCIIYIYDETEVVHMMRQIQEEQLVIGSIYVDNYDELLNRNLNVQRNVKAAMIDQTIGVYFSNVGGVVRKLERDRYFVIFKKKYLGSLERNKFEILDQIKKLDIDENRAVTISVGLGANEDYLEAEKSANNALELALGRGGDQVVVKDGEHISFYGGKTRQSESSSRVKARVRANNMRDIFVSKERVVAMGHKIADIDSFAATMGIYKAARAMGKKAYIVINPETNTIKPVINTFLEDNEYGQGVFVTPEQAQALVDEETALVIVDVNKPEIFECPDLVQNTKSVILIDHHLQSGEKIDNLVLSYIEPTASSASEMVTEILQYVPDRISFKKIEAEALYAGILIDTDFFTRNTGVRTFEAAAFLRKNGIDIQNVQNQFRDTLETTKVKAQAMGTVEEIVPGYVMAVSDSEGVANPTVVAAQIANELLNIQNVKASFVMTNIAGRTHISARSIGSTNVQLVMEKLGGGGHLNIAGCQLDETSIEDAKRILSLTLQKMIDENDLV